jgi:fatty acid desaturase
MEPANTGSDEFREKAEQRVDELLEFRNHVLIYLAVNALLFSIWLVVALVVGGAAWFPWFLFPLLGWGIGVFMQAMDVYAFSGHRREKAVAKELEKMKKE